MMANINRSERQPGKRDTTSLDEYDEDINSYVNKCPLHLFDTQTNRNISRPDLTNNISQALRRWMEVPLTCSEIVQALFDVLPPDVQQRGAERLTAYIWTAMTKHPLIDDESLREAVRPTIKARDWDGAVLPAFRGLIERKRAQTSKPSHQEAQEQIAMFGQYAILSHCWDQDNSQELTFDDVANISDLRVRAKNGYRKLTGFAETVESRYGCRYLWMDTACIRETDRSVSIPLMFSWYRHAYLCVVYLSTSTISEDRWCTRGWTLQELLAATRVVCFTGSWDPVGVDPDAPASAYKFHACRDSFTVTSVYFELVRRLGHLDWMAYTPGVDGALNLLRAMHERKTTKPEDMVYSLLSALDIDIPIEYGEGFERAFYRLQTEILTQGHDRRLLLWGGSTSSPYNSMLSGDFHMSSISHLEEYHSSGFSPSFDPAITFDSDGIMHIMVYLYRPQPSRLSHVFALMGKRNDKIYVGVLLQELPEQMYRRIGYQEYRKDETWLVDKEPEWIYIE